MQKKKATWSLVILIFVFTLLAASAMHEFNTGEDVPITPLVSTSTPVLHPAPSPSGLVTLHIGETATFSFTPLSISPLSVIEESRCPQGVQCIQAGTVKVSLRLGTPTKSTTASVALNKSVIAGDEKVVFVSATPYPQPGIEMLPQDYEFTFNVGPNSVPTSVDVNPNVPNPGSSN